MVNGQLGRSRTWIFGGLQRHTCESLPTVHNLVAAAPQPSHVLTTPGGGVGPEHFDPTQRKSGLADGYVTLTVVQTPP